MQGSKKRAAAISAGEDAGVSAAKRLRPALGAYADDVDPSPLQYVSLNEVEVRTAIKVLYVKIGAPPEGEWWGTDGTINFIFKQLNGGGKGTVEDTLRRTQAAEEKMNVDVRVVSANFS